MTIITGNVKKFKNMFATIMCGNSYPLFTEVVLEIDQEIISISCADTTKAVGTNQEYRGFNIEGSKNIPIDTVSISEALKLFDDGDDLKFEYDSNRIVLSADSNGKKDQIVIPAPDIDNINSQFPVKFTDDSIIINGNEMKFDARVIVNAKYIQNQIKKANYVDALYHEYSIDINNNTLILSVGNMDKFELSTSTEIEVEGTGIAQSKYMHGYDDIFKSLSGDVTIQINENKPMYVSQVTDNYSIKFLIAPIISE